METTDFEAQIKQKAEEYIMKMRENATLTPSEKGIMTQWIIQFVENGVLAVFAETQRQHKLQVKEWLDKILIESTIDAAIEILDPRADWQKGYKMGFSSAIKKVNEKFEALLSEGLEHG